MNSPVSVYCGEYQAPVLRITGEASARTAPLLRKQLMDALVAEPHTLTVDLTSAVCDIDGLRVLHEIICAAGQANTLLAFIGVSPELSRLSRTHPVIRR